MVYTGQFHLEMDDDWGYSHDLGKLQTECAVHLRFEDLALVSAGLGIRRPKVAPGSLP